MSSGRNWIRVKRVGKTREKLAELICALTGGTCDAEDIERTNPTNQHFEDCCAWTVDVQIGSQRVNYYSWDKMKDCVKFGIVLLKGRGSFAEDGREICANEPK